MTRIKLSTFRHFDPPTFLWAFGLLGAWAFLAAGCSGGGDFGEAVSIAPDRRLRLDDPLAAGKAIQLPGTGSFNVADAQRFSSGAAQADASADAAGKAVCRAAADGGSAWAEFQLGQVLDHRGERPVEAVVTFHVNYRYRMAAPTATTLPTVTSPPSKTRFALKAYIQDSNKRVLKRLMLADAEPDKGPQEWTGKQSPSFDVVLEPGLAYHLVLAGRVEAAGSEATTQPAGPSCTCEIEVASLEIEVEPRVATAMQRR